jgi:hypothetical protein
MICKIIGVRIIFPKALQQRKLTDKWQEQFYYFLSRMECERFPKRVLSRAQKFKSEFGAHATFYLVGTRNTFHGRGRHRTCQVVKLTNHLHPVARLGATRKEDLYLYIYNFFLTLKKL